MSEIVSRVYVEVDGEVIEANSISEKVSGNKEPVRVMNRRNRAKGHHHGVPEFSLSLSFPADLDLSHRFEKMLVNNTQFSTTVEAEGEDGTTQTTTYLDCEVYEVSKDGREGSAQELSVDVTALDVVHS